MCNITPTQSTVGRFKLGNHANPLRVATTLELGRDENVAQLQRKSDADYATAETEHVRVVVHTRVTHTKSVRSDGGADAVEFIRGNRHTDSGAAAEYPRPALTADNRAADLGGVFGIVDTGG